MNPAALLGTLPRRSYASRYEEGLAPLLSRATSLKFVLTASDDMGRRN